MQAGLPAALLQSVGNAPLLFDDVRVAAEVRGVNVPHSSARPLCRRPGSSRLRTGAPQENSDRQRERCANDDSNAQNAPICLSNRHSWRFALEAYVRNGVEEMPNDIYI